MTEASLITEADLHGYADGLLGEADRVRVERYLEENPDAAELVSKWEAQNVELRRTFAPYERSHPDDLDLLLTRPRLGKPRARLASALAAVAIFLTGAAAGHYGPALGGKDIETVTTAASFPREAQDAYLVYVGEVRHPVEVFAEEEAHLATWLGKRLAVADLKIPALQALGFQLVGGRLIPVAGKPGGMFMYEDQAGQRVTIVLARNRDNTTTSFRFHSAGSIETFYWIDGELGYAVTGEVSRQRLQEIAQACYEQVS